MNKQRLTQDLMIDEGIRYQIYTCSEGHKTVGIGHLIVKGDKEFGKPIGTIVSEDRVLDLFKQDLAVAVSETEELYGEQFHSWPDHVQEILLNMMFNMGRPTLSKFKNFRVALEARDWKKAANEGRDSRWYRQVTNRAEKLMSRLEKVND